MKCEDCDGSGHGEPGRRCFVCNGTGGRCDVCGDPVDDFGMDVCNECQEEDDESAG